MTDINKEIRVELMKVLDETLTYDGSLIPCYNVLNPNEWEKVYLLMHTQTAADDSNMSSEVVEGTIIIEAVHRSGENVTYDVVDEITKGVKELLSNGVDDPAGFRVVRLRWLSDTDASFLGGNSNIMRRILRYEYTIEQL